MLRTRKLDDQSFDEIVEQAKGRLPWLCPVWTDHNAHDPGITLLELMAWYKELQQFHMDQLTPDIQRKLLELAGIRLEMERAATCALEIGTDAPSRLSLSRLTNEQEVVFELAEPHRISVVKALNVIAVQLFEVVYKFLCFNALGKNGCIAGFLEH